MNTNGLPNNTPIPERLKQWQSALEEGDVKAALEHHDVVAAHIVKHKDSAQVFKLAEMNPSAFVHWNTLKKTIREQLAKSPEQMEADYAEAVEQIMDFAEKLAEARTAKSVVGLVPQIQESLQHCVLNASFLDDMEEEPEPEEEEDDGDGDDSDEAEDTGNEEDSGDERVLNIDEGDGGDDSDSSEEDSDDEDDDDDEENEEEQTAEKADENTSKKSDTPLHVVRRKSGG